MDFTMHHQCAQDFSLHNAKLSDAACGLCVSVYFLLCSPLVMLLIALYRWYSWYFLDCFFNCFENCGSCYIIAALDIGVCILLIGITMRLYFEYRKSELEQHKFFISNSTVNHSNSTSSCIGEFRQNDFFGKSD